MIRNLRVLHIKILIVQIIWIKKYNTTIVSSISILENCVIQFDSIHVTFQKLVYFIKDNIIIKHHIHIRRNNIT